MLEHQNIKIFLKTAMFQTDLKKLLWLKKSKMMFNEHMLLVIWAVRKLLERFTKKNCKRQIKKSLKLKK